MQKSQCVEAEFLSQASGTAGAGPHAIAGVIQALARTQPAPPSSSVGWRKYGMAYVLEIIPKIKKSYWVNIS